MKKKLPRVIFLAADTIRSRAYAQAMKNLDYELEAILMVNTGQKKWGQSDAVKLCHTKISGLFSPDLNKSLADSCDNLSQIIEEITCDSINSLEIITWLGKKKPNLVIFSGFGGEIIKKDVLNTASLFLHIHSGFLPNYRGSTTSYYSYLNENKLGVTAILMEETIDSGIMIERKNYKPPPQGVDFDYSYDSMIRADVLIRALDKYNSKKGTFFDPIGRQSDEQSVTYYIIHPLLKHLAINKMYTEK